jgi:hypothetical protein
LPVVLDINVTTAVALPTRRVKDCTVQHSGNTPPDRGPPARDRWALGDPTLSYHTARRSQNTTGYSSLLPLEHLGQVSQAGKEE